MEAKIAGKIIELNGELFHYKVLIAGGYFSSYRIPMEFLWNSHVEKLIWTMSQAA
jgi:hypothetical protein